MCYSAQDVQQVAASMITGSFPGVALLSIGRPILDKKLALPAQHSCYAAFGPHYRIRSREDVCSTLWISLNALQKCFCFYSFVEAASITVKLARKPICLQVKTRGNLAGKMKRRGETSWSETFWLSYAKGSRN